MTTNSFILYRLSHKQVDHRLFLLNMSQSIIYLGLQDPISIICPSIPNKFKINRNPISGKIEFEDDIYTKRRKRNNKLYPVCNRCNKVLLGKNEMNYILNKKL